MNLSRLTTSLVLSLSVSVLWGCASPRHAAVYEESPTWSGQRAGYQYGVVSQIEQLSSRQSNSGAGALIGGVVGAVVGRQFGGAGEGRTTGTVLGAIGGAIAGNEIEHQNHPQAGRFRVVVNLDGGGARAFNLADPGDLRPGDRVVIDGQSLRRY